MDIPLLLIRANDVCFLGGVRGSAAASAPFDTVTYTWPGAKPWYSEHSAHLRGSTSIANPFTDPAAALRQLIAVATAVGERHGTRPLAVPSSDTNMMFLLDNEAELRPYLRLMGSAELDAGRLDVVRKDTCAELLAAAGVPIPSTVACRTQEDIEQAVASTVYPCIYKPITKDYGQTFYARHGGAKAIDAPDADTLRARLRAEIDDGFELLVQQRVFFDSVHDEIPCYVYVDAEHRVRMAATAVKHTIVPHPYGTATVLYLTWHPELLEAAQRVASALRWRGILMIEFIKDQRDGVWKVIEVNGRPWLFVDFFRRFGLNYLGYLHDDARGVRDHWPELSVPSPQLLSERPVHIDLPGSMLEPLSRLTRPPEVEDVTGFLESLPGRRTLTFLDPGDPRPGIAELEDLAQRHGLKPDRLVDRVQDVLSGD